MTGGYLLLGGNAKPKHPVAGPPATPADQIFAADPAAMASGRTQTLSAITAVGSTVVAAGAETGGAYPRAQFFVSVDGGLSWQPGRQQAVDGTNPAPGEAPQFVAGAPGAWAALGGISSGVADWTSRDGRTWTRQANSAAFEQPDSPTGIARTATGFVAVGTTTVNGAQQGVLWTSPDGRSWTRVGADTLKPPAGGVITQLGNVAAHDDTVVVHGVLALPKKKPVEEFWRSTDGGRTWAVVTVPQAQGSGGDAAAVVATGSGFFTARQAQRTTGPKKHKKTVHYTVVFGSADGSTWAPTGQITLPDYGSLDGITGSDSGPMALVSVGGAKTAVLTSTDGKSWKRVGDLTAADQVADAALTPMGALVAGHVGASGLLAVPGGADVNLGAVAGERTVDAVAGAPGGEVVAVGSTNGSAAAWTSATGSSWTRASLPTGDAAGRLTSLVHGQAGWLAVGQAGTQPLVLTSADGTNWLAVKIAGTVVSAAAGPGGYVIVGSGPAGAAAWTSTDLKTWTAAAGAGKTDLTGAKSVMSAVAAASAGYVAVGSQGAVPAAWTSPDGKTWTLKAAPAVNGALTRLVTNGPVLIASGSTPTGALVLRSADGGTTWQPVGLSGLAAGNAVTAATVASGRFVLAGTVGTAGGCDVVLWSSADGTNWLTSRPHGTGLDGPGVQQLTGLSYARNLLLGVGFTGNSQADESTLWWAPVPAPVTAKK